MWTPECPTSCKRETCLRMGTNCSPPGKVEPLDTSGLARAFIFSRSLIVRRDLLEGDLGLTKSKEHMLRGHQPIDVCVKKRVCVVGKLPRIGGVLFNWSFFAAWKLQWWTMVRYHRKDCKTHQPLVDVIPSIPCHWWDGGPAPSRSWRTVHCGSTATDSGVGSGYIMNIGTNQQSHETWGSQIPTQRGTSGCYGDLDPGVWNVMIPSKQ